MEISKLVGETLKSITVVDKEDEDRIVFETNSGKKFLMSHHQDCCESVVIDDVCGDLDDLIGSPVLIAEERSHSPEYDDGDDSQTWTFYELATNKGSVTIRWYGTSNGYYSESVSFEEISG